MLFTEQKKELRRIMKRTLKAMTAEERHAKSAKIIARVLKLKFYRKAKTALGYCSFDTEVETDELLQAVLRDGKRLALPRLNPFNNTLVLHQVEDLINDLEVHALGFREPRASLPILTMKEIEFIAVPGLAFDEYGERLGRGMGCYDRLIADAKRKNKLVGLAFDCQILGELELPTDMNDLPVDLIVTESRKINPDDALSEFYEANKGDFDDLFDDMGIVDEKW